MKKFRRLLRASFEPLEAALDRVFTPAWNPLYHLGALGFFYFWVVAVSGIYIYLFFDTGTEAAYQSIEYMTVDQWYLAGVMRSLHRYASDGLVLMMMIHMVREFSLDRYRGARWFTWVTGIPVWGLVVVSGITGYWLVWDQLAQYVAIASTEWLDWLPLFGEPIARNFLHSGSLDSRFFTLLIFIHIAVPLILLFILWIHLQRVSKAKINPPRGLAIGTFVMLVVLSFVEPAISQGQANLDRVPSEVGLDWFYLGFYPILDIWGSGALWGLVSVLGLIVILLPWMPAMRRAPAAVVDLANCNGCERCVDDCPYAAVIMQPRSDGLPFDIEAVVDPSLCVSCGICAGACPTSTPFRRASELTPGIELPHYQLRELRDRLEKTREGTKKRVIVFGCDHGNALDRIDRPNVAAIRMPCVGMLPPSFIDYILSRDIAAGILVAGCRESTCHFRFGMDWTKARVDRERDPHLRKRVPRERIALVGVGPADAARLRGEVDAFLDRLDGLDAEQPAPARELV